MSGIERLTIPVGQPRSIRPIAILLGLAGLAAIGWIQYAFQLVGVPMLLFALAGACFGVLTIIRPALGVIALVLAAAFVRVEIGTGTGSPIVASLVIACVLLAGWLVHQMLHNRRINYLPAYVLVPGILFIGFTVFSLLWGAATLDPRITYPQNFYRVQIAATLLTVVSVGLLFVGGDLLRNWLGRAALVSTYVAVGFLALPFRWFDWNLPFVNTAGLFGLWFVAICWANAIVNRSLPDWLRVILGGGAIGWLAMAFFQQGSWVSGWLPPMIAILSVTIIARPRLGLTLAIIAVIIGAVYYSTFYDVLITQQQAEGSLGGSSGRFELWRRNLSFISDRLLFGTGPAGYVLYYVTFIPDEAMSTHSNWVDILAQTGVMGLLSFIALFAGIWILGVRTRSNFASPSDRALHAAVVGALPAVGFSLFFGDWLIPFIYNQTIAGFDHSVYSWLMFAAMCGLFAQKRDPVYDNA